MLVRRASLLLVCCTASVLSALTACGGSEEGTEPVAVAGAAGTEAGSETSAPDSAQDTSQPPEDAPSAEAADDTVQPPQDGPGADTLAPECAPPTDTSKASLCLSVKPETITPVPGVEQLDGVGVLVVEVFDTPQVDLPDGGTVEALATAVLPEQDGGTIATVDLLSAPLPQIRFEALPASTLYVRAFFFDNFNAFVAKKPLPGTWLGGYDLSNGLSDKPPLQPVVLGLGVATSRELPLIALRALTLNLSLGSGASPLGDGQGAGAGVLIKTQQPGTSEPIFGIGTAACVDIKSPAKAVVHGLFVGTGPYYVLGSVDDFGGGSSLPAGTITNLDWSGTTPQLPAAALLTFAPGAYQVSMDLQLSHVIPFAGTIPPDTTHCGTTDAGLEAGSTDSSAD